MGLGLRLGLGLGSGLERPLSTCALSLFDWQARIRMLSCVASENMSDRALPLFCEDVHTVALLE